MKKMQKRDLLSFLQNKKMVSKCFSLVSHLSKIMAKFPSSNYDVFGKWSNMICNLIWLGKNLASSIGINNNITKV